MKFCLVEKLCKTKKKYENLMCKYTAFSDNYDNNKDTEKEERNTNRHASPQNLRVFVQQIILLMIPTVQIPYFKRLPHLQVASAGPLCDGVVACIFDQLGARLELNARFRHKSTALGAHDDRLFVCTPVVDADLILGAFGRDSESHHVVLITRCCEQLLHVFIRHASDKPVTCGGQPTPHCVSIDRVHGCSADHRLCGAPRAKTRLVPAGCYRQCLHESLKKYVQPPECIAPTSNGMLIIPSFLATFYFWIYTENDIEALCVQCSCTVCTTEPKGDSQILERRNDQ